MYYYMPLHDVLSHEYDLQTIPRYAPLCKGHSLLSTRGAINMEGHIQQITVPVLPCELSKDCIKGSSEICTSQSALRNAAFL